VMATPAVLVGFTRLNGSAADGRCKSFGAGADGTGWAEGAGMLVLERLSDANRNGHRVLAVLAGSAVNQDGASNGLTAPNGPAQQRVIRAALATAQVAMDQVDAVEAHGSGTSLGDPIEAQALLATYGRDRDPDRPLWLGSVKSNIGHTQAAAGSAAMIKMVLALQHGLLPATLHVDEPSPHVDWTSGAVRLLAEPVPWPATQDRPRRAGISGFGMSGTNVHVILEEAPVSPARDFPPARRRGAVSQRLPSSPGTGSSVLAPARPVGSRGPGETVPWLVSGRTPGALAAQAARLRDWVAARPETDPGDVAWSLATTRPAFDHRAVITGADREELLTGLAAVAAGETGPGVISGVSAEGVNRAVFVFAGQGAQWAGMGAELAASSPVFAGRLAECAQALAPWVGWSLPDVLAGTDGAPSLDAAEVAQPALWAVLVSLAATWQAAGITPAAVIGHSQGEIAAATVAGILSLEDAAKVVAIRGRALSRLGVVGAMVSVMMPAGRVRDLLSRWGDRLAVAAVNGPAQVVVSGELDALAEFEAELAARRVLRWRVPGSDFVAHSPRVAALAQELTEDLADVVPAAGRIRLFSTVLGRWAAGTELDAGYWYANVREPVRFDEAVRALAQDGYRTFIEISPNPVLETAIRECLDDSEHQAAVVTGTLSRHDAGLGGLVRALARAHVAGSAVDWAAVLGGGRVVELPTYAFQRERYWPELPQVTAAGGDGPRAAGEARFWAAVEGGDVQALATALAVDGRQPLTEVVPALAAWRRRELDRSATAPWRYRVEWAPAAVPAPAADGGRGVLAGTWLVLTPGEVAGDLVTGCVRALSGHGARLVTACGAAGLSRAELAALLGRTASGTGQDELAGVLSLLALALAQAPVPGYPGVPGELAGTLALVQALGDAEMTAPLWVVTSGAVTTGAGERLASPAQAMVWGLGRVAALEHPDRWGGLVDVPQALDERAEAQLAAVLAGRGEDQVAIRGAGIMSRRLARAPQPRGTGKAWVPRGSVLVTGGTGAIGGHVARLGAARGAARVMLTSRSGPGGSGVAGLAAELAQAGSAVAALACDVASAAQVAGVLAWARATGPAVSAVLHAAGAGESVPIADATPATLASVVRAKAGGAAVLDELTRDGALEQFVLFSSISATWGSGLQPGYAAANAFLDALAQNRRGRGLAATAVAWGAWDGGGMTDAQSAVQLERRGLRLMDPEVAVRALGQVIDCGEAQVTVADVDWARFAAAFTLRRPSPLIAGLPEVAQALAGTAGSGAAAPGAGAELAERLAGLAEGEQLRMLTAMVRTEAAAVLGHTSPDAVEPGRAFRELGFDSLTAVELRNRLAAVTGLRLPATLVFDYPTPAVLAGHLHAKAVKEKDQPDVFYDLGRLSSALSSMTSEESRSDIATRLESILRDLRAGPAMADAAGDHDIEEAASDDEMFDLVKRELDSTDFEISD